MKPECIERTRHDCLRILDGRDNALDPLRQSELVVIGGTGFVGIWIAEMVAALNDGYQFGIKLSLISRSTDQFVNRLPHLAKRPDINLIKSDVRQLGQFPSNADWVIHAAANPDVRMHASNPLDTASVIVDGTMSVMRTAERLGQLKKLLYLSSGLVCGAQEATTNGVAENAHGAPPQIPASSTPTLNVLQKHFVLPHARNHASRYWWQDHSHSSVHISRWTRRGRRPPSCPMPCAAITSEY